MEGKKFAGFNDDAYADSGVFSFNSTSNSQSSSSAAVAHPPPIAEHGIRGEYEEEEDDVSVEVHRSLARLDLMQSSTQRMANNTMSVNTHNRDLATPTPKLNEDGDTLVVM